MVASDRRESRGCSGSTCKCITLTSVVWMHGEKNKALPSPVGGAAGDGRSPRKHPSSAKMLHSTLEATESDQPGAKGAPTVPAGLAHRLVALRNPRRPIIQPSTTALVMPMACKA
jgi:hypothetical protein